MRHTGRARARTAGFSLIELMVAMTLGLIVMTALVALFVNTSRTNQEMAKTNSQIDNARFALNILSDDLMHGGFWGGYIPVFDDLASSAVPTDVPASVPGPCTAYSSWDAAYYNGLIGIPLQFYNGVPSGCSTVVTNIKSSTDVVLVRHADTCALVWNATTSAFEAESTTCNGLVANAAYFQASRCETCARYALGTAASALTLQRRQCDGRRAPIYRLISNIYYIRDFAVTSGDGIPTLVRSELGVSGSAPAQQAAVALVEGIEGFRVEVGVDSLSETGAAVDYTVAANWQDTARTIVTNRGDGIPDGSPPFVHCGSGCTVAQLSNVSAVRIYVLARANEATPGYTDTKTYTLGTQTLGPFNDGFKRHVFSTTVRFVNITSRRETP